MNIESANHFNFTVSDVEKSVKFYTEVLGMELLDISGREPSFARRAIGLPEISVKIAYLNGNGFKIELIEYNQPGKTFERSGDEITYGHICLNVTGLREFYIKHKDKIRFMSEPLKIPGGPNKNGYMLYLFDLDNNKIELIDKNESK